MLTYAQVKIGSLPSRRYLYLFGEKCFSSFQNEVWYLESDLIQDGS